MHQRGLTLLEMMVVLLISSMAIALGFQSLGQWQRTNAAIAAISSGNLQQSLTESWLENAMRGLIPLKEDVFAGAPDRLHGVTTRPVQQHQGGATAMTWSIRDDDGLLLVLEEDQSPPLQLPLPGARSAHFSYVDSTGKVHAQWPPKLGLHDQLPALVVLTQEMEDGHQQLWASAIAGQRNPYFNPYEDEFD